ncbi:hypothetical protein ACFL6X_07720 [Candidatus Latescibacterota bacterium]
MQLVCEGHPQIGGVTQGFRLVLNHPTALDDPVIDGASDAEGSGASIYGSVIEDSGVYRMWYQAWPRDWQGGDEISVACAESDDGVTWRRPRYGLVESCGSLDNHLTDLPFHCPSVLVDPHATDEARYRAFGYTDPVRVKGRYTARVDSRGYYTAHSADGIHWEVDSSQPTWPHADVITSVWDDRANCALVALKHNGLCKGMFRRRFFTATWDRGQASEPVSAFFPDELDDLSARSRGFVSADYYGVGLMPTDGPTIGFLWNFRHQQPIGHSEPRAMYYGSVGQVDLSVVYQLERGGRWLHLPGRPDWFGTADAPPWARGALYTAASPIHVGDETWLYFTGTREYHGWSGIDVDPRERRERIAEEGGFSRIGLLKWKRDRVTGYRAEHRERIAIEPRSVATPDDAGLRLNAVTGSGGSIRVALVDAEHQPLPGYGYEDCEPIAGDHLEAVVRWRGRADVPRISEQDPALAMVEIEGGTLYAFDYRRLP